jgi:mevalonate kinase
MVESRIAGYAPGKIILFGEHAVVYGEPALGMPLKLGVEGELVPGRGRVSVKLPRGIDVKRSKDAASPERLVASALEEIAGEHDVAITIGFPPMSGFGSSAALAVALLRAKQAITRERVTRSLLLERAMKVEEIAHGVSSGVDPAICLWDALISYERHAGRRRIRRIRPKKPVHLVVGSRGGHGGTGRSVLGVRSLMEDEPSLMRAAMGLLGTASRAGIKSLAAGDLALAGRAMDLAHGVLSGLGLVSDDVEEMVKVARSAGALGAKMSGAGGKGGAFLALAPNPKIQGRVLDRLVGQGAIAWGEVLD